MLRGLEFPSPFCLILSAYIARVRVVRGMWMHVADTPPCEGLFLFSCGSWGGAGDLSTFFFRRWCCVEGLGLGWGGRSVSVLDRTFSVVALKEWMSQAGFTVHFSCSG